MVISERKCGSYWRKIRDYKERTFCKKITDTESIESKQHIWLECKNNRQNLVWTSAEAIWEKTTARPWPNVTLSLMDYDKDSDRPCILISMAIWAIWKARTKML